MDTWGGVPRVPRLYLSGAGPGLVPFIQGRGVFVSDSDSSFRQEGGACFLRLRGLAHAEPLLEIPAPQRCLSGPQLP